jgi:arabinofuranosyltransferase
LKTSRELRLAFALSLGVFLVLVGRFWFVCDDAFIAFRYARNLAEGVGLRFNAGEQTPVEGFTELPWVLLCALMDLVRLDVSLSAPIVSVLCGVVLLGRVLTRVAATGARPLTVLCTGFFLATLPPLFVWSSGGLATVPFALVIFLAWESLLADGVPADRRGALRAGLWLVAVVLMRADGVGWAVTLCAIPFLHWTREERRRALLPAAGVLLAGLVAVTAFRLAYFDDWLPNTARAKLGLTGAAFERGGLYLATMSLAMPALPLSFLFSLGRGLLRDHQASACLALVGATLAHALLTGGDFMCFGRFLVPATPFLALLLARRLGKLGMGRATFLTGTLVLLSLTTAFDLVRAPGSWREAVHFRWNYLVPRTELAQWRRMDAQAREWRDLGTALARHTNSGDSFTYGAMGAIGYFSRLFLYDHNGLITREVALREPLGHRRSPGHDKTVPKAFFLKNAPTYMDAFLWPEDVALPAHIDRERERWIAVPLGEGDPRPDHVLYLEPGPGYEGSGTDEE